VKAVYSSIFNANLSVSKETDFLFCFRLISEPDAMIYKTAAAESETT
jgi:hypothetical protein